jgi:CHAT domain-containing protein
VRFFGVGDPRFKGPPDEKPSRFADYFDERGGRVDAVGDLAALPGTRLEIEKIAKLLGARRSDYVLGIEASETELRKARRAGQLSEAQVVAFATHGLVGGEIVGTVAEPALALTPPPSPSEIDDGLLTSSEVARLDLRAELVLLSACRTAAGNTLEGEGLTGLARAFFAAGAHTLVVSHWRVRDDVAARLTVRTIELMRAARPLGAAEALRTAMWELVSDHSADRSEISFAHPAIWAAFATVGSY